MNRTRARRAAAIGVAGILTAVVLLVLAEPAAAAPNPPPAVNDLRTVIDNLRFWVMGIIGAVASLFLCLGGARYLLAGGDPSEIERAKGSLKSAAVGYGLALLAPVVLTILNGILLA